MIERKDQSLNNKEMQLRMLRGELEETQRRIREREAERRGE